MKLLTIPASWLYGLGVAIRHALYDQHILPSFGAEVPTICVGNIAVGGTGGRHRSVAIAAALTEYLNAKGVSAENINRDIKK